MTAQATRYSAVAIALHWLIAVTLIANVALGVWMHDAIDVESSQAQAIQGYQLHKSLGFMVLLLTVLRIGWRLSHKPPALPTGMSTGQQVLAKWVHLSFYCLLLLIPLSGWLLVSSQWRGDTALNVETVLFDRITIPHLFGLDQQTEAVRQQTAGVLVNVHWLLALGTGLLVLLHVGAALKHQLFDRDRLIARMLFELKGAGEWCAAIATMGLLGFGLYYAYLTLQTTSTESMVADSVAAAVAEQSSISSAPDGWQVVPDASSIGFSGVHAGTAFSGEFLRWTIDARLNAQDLTKSQLGRVSVDMASAITGKSLYDRTLPEREWFDVANYPTATFEMRSIDKNQGDSYRLRGELLLKDRRVGIDNLSLVPILNDDDGGGVKVQGEVRITRAEANLGMASDPDGAWVSTQILVTIEAVLKPPPN